jgi:hypothetical protein
VPEIVKTQIGWILFSRAANPFGIRGQKQLKLTAFCSAGHRKKLKPTNKAIQIDGENLIGLEIEPKTTRARKNIRVG